MFPAPVYAADSRGPIVTGVVLYKQGSFADDNSFVVMVCTVYKMHHTFESVNIIFVGCCLL
jgi:hypothetical protein